MIFSPMRHRVTHSDRGIKPSPGPTCARTLTMTTGDGGGHAGRRSRRHLPVIYEGSPPLAGLADPSQLPSSERTGHPIMNDAPGPDESSEKPTEPTEPLRSPRRGAFPTPRRVIDQATEFVPQPVAEESEPPHDSPSDSHSDR